MTPAMAKAITRYLIKNYYTDNDDTSAWVCDMPAMRSRWRMTFRGELTGSGNLSFITSSIVEGFNSTHL